MSKIRASEQAPENSNGGRLLDRRALDSPVREPIFIID